MKGRFGEKANNWKNGIRIYNGYVYFYSFNHPSCGKQRMVKRARLVAEKILGYYLKPTEIVHHIGIHFSLNSIENKQDDNPENLFVFEYRNAHVNFHKYLNKNPILKKFLESNLKGRR